MTTCLGLRSFQAQEYMLLYVFDYLSLPYWLHVKLIQICDVFSKHKKKNFEPNILYNVQCIKINYFAGEQIYLELVLYKLLYY